MVRIEIDARITIAQLIQLACQEHNTKLLAGWEGAYVTLAALPCCTANELSGKPDGNLRKLDELLASRKPQNNQEHFLPSFTTGVIGHLTYEASQDLEPSLRLPMAMDNLPSISFSAYDASISLHVTTGKLYAFGVTSRAATRISDWLNSKMTRERDEQVPSKKQLDYLKSSMSAEEYKNAVEDMRQRILAGDFFQANLTRMLELDLGDSPRAYVAGFAERLLSQSQAPFGAILNLADATVISASPERFFRIENADQGRRIFAEPIKGTRPRHTDPELDTAFKEALRSSEKDRAENIMIADLVRNDLSRVCTDESIKADPVCELRSYKNVHHLVTRISGILKEDATNLDALLTQFPCGSITGAPKWAAMDAIAELEQCGRGIYCGAIGYFDDRGHADFSIAIRTAVVSYNASGASLTYGTGGGITVLSDPEEEFTETEDKAAGFLRALQL